MARMSFEKALERKEHNLPVCLQQDNGDPTIVADCTTARSFINKIGVLLEGRKSALESPAEDLSKETRKALKRDVKELTAYFGRFGIYDPEYVKEKFPSLYDGIDKILNTREAVKQDKKKEKDVAKDSELQAYEDAINSPDGKLIGYARVSVNDSSLDDQIQALREKGCSYIYKEKVASRDATRPQYQKMLSELKAGHTLVIPEISRLSRSTTDLFKVVEDLTAKGVHIISLKEKWLNTTSSKAKLVLTIMSDLAEFEKDQLRERQAEGIKVSKTKGVKFGKQLSENANIDRAMQMYYDGGFSVSQIAEMNNISRTTLWRRIRDAEGKKQLQALENN